MQLTNPYKLDTAQLTEEETLLWENLPESYQTFLEQHNGGFVEGQVNFYTNICAVEDGVQKHDTNNSIKEFLAIISYDNHQQKAGKPHSVLHFLADRAASHVMPQNIIPIALCHDDSIICMSLNDHDYGKIYYYEINWHLERFKQFFDERIQEAASSYRDINPRAVNQENIDNDMNYMLLVTVADDFHDFLNNVF